MSSPNNPLPNWHRAYGRQIIQGVIKKTPSDFQVTETLGFDLTDAGEHDYLWLEKTAANTAWAARALAEFAGVSERDVGFAGLKDRHAVTRQWFSVRRPNATGTDWSAFAADGLRIVKTSRHQRKLKRGAHSGNHFRIAVRTDAIASTEVVNRLQRIQSCGVPNYFGEQRFGRNAGNLQLARRLFAGKRMQRDKRSMALSAARSMLFNTILSERVGAGTWDKALPGDIMNLEGSRSIFSPPEIDAELLARTAAMDIHPTGAMWGDGLLTEFDRHAVATAPLTQNLSEFVAGLEIARLKAARRALRLVVKQLGWEIDAGVIWLEFSLGKGSYATSVLRELVE